MANPTQISTGRFVNAPKVRDVDTFLKKHYAITDSLTPWNFTRTSSVSKWEESYFLRKDPRGN